MAVFRLPPPYIYILGIMGGIKLRENSLDVRVLAIYLLGNALGGKKREPDSSNICYPAPKLKILTDIVTCNISKLLILFRIQDLLRGVSSERRPLQVE